MLNIVRHLAGESGSIRCSIDDEACTYLTAWSQTEKCMHQLLGFVIICINMHLDNSCLSVSIVMIDLFLWFILDVCSCAAVLVARSAVMMLLAASSHYCIRSVSQRSSPAMVVGAASSSSQVQSNPAVVVDSALLSLHAVPTAPYASQSFAELSDSLGFIAGVRIGDMLRTVPRRCATLWPYSV